MTFSTQILNGKLTAHTRVVKEKGKLCRRVQFWTFGDQILNPWEEDPQFVNAAHSVCVQIQRRKT